MPFRDVDDGVLGDREVASDPTVGTTIGNSLDDLRREFIRFRALSGLSTERCQTNEPTHQYSFDEYFYEVTKERHSVRAASWLSLKVLSDKSAQASEA